MSVHSSRGKEWAALAETIKHRDNYTCQYNLGGCTVDTDLTVDHITPKVNGGTDDDWNLLTACRTCNGKKSDKTLTRVTWIDKDWMSV